ncbi:lipoate-protein ligase A [Thermotomaculum hydrothermale]|uniref:Lipoate-protein ligase A n=1 Tax=Thermotomaculum hydrothermale TaxID=981385 RepID=A0A7R6T0F7_9BACT|nr:lipoate--protein ligase family protein [Thermotomaculum hydrothermale]BBB33647.1 lipoate-protein ligase A [Thermotomaculum hydrothermale]
MIDLEFYPFEYNSPQTNMKIDEFFLTKSKGFVFRLYGWKPYGVSIGFSQQKEKVCNVSYCEKNKIDIVKRITGGGAVYHKNDITYMISFPLEFYNDKTVLGIYRKNAEILMKIFTSLELNCQFAGKVKRELRREGMKNGIACFLLPSDFEILVNGKKIVGNALRVEKNRVLQHGSIAFDFDYEETAIVLNTQKERLKKRVISLKELLPSLTIQDYQEKCIECLKQFGFPLNFKTNCLPFKD